MFKGLGQFANLMRQLPKMREEMENIQKRMREVVAEGDAGAGMVRIRANAQFEILSCCISDELVKLQDREMLEDLVRAAANQALQKAREMAIEETSRLARNFNFSPDANLPDVTGE